VYIPRSRKSSPVNARPVSQPLCESVASCSTEVTLPVELSARFSEEGLGVWCSEPNFSCAKLTKDFFAVTSSMEVPRLGHLVHAAVLTDPKPRRASLASVSPTLPAPPARKDEKGWLAVFGRIGSPRDLVSNPEKSCIVFTIKMDRKTIVTISEVSHRPWFDQLFKDSESVKTLMMKKLKFLIVPVNLGLLPMPARGPKDAELLYDYFEPKNVYWTDTAADTQNGNCRCIHIYIDFFSKWIIKRFMPLLAFKPGRVCDFFVVDWQDRVMVASFRLSATPLLIQQLAN